jgi:hypothetical protein
VTTDPNMDPIDERLKQAMKALDNQVPDRYFEQLPERTLGRLEELMQSDVDRPGGSAAGTSQTSVPSVSASTAKPERQEDSGLHDIRALAQTTKQRMSQRRIPTQAPPVDDAVLNSSSASLRMIAVPDPDKLVPVEPIAMGNGTGSAAATRESAPLLAASTTRPAIATAAPAPAPITPIKAKSKAPIVVGSLVVAAAAGVVGYMALNKKNAASDKAPLTAAAPGGMPSSERDTPTATQTVSAPTVTPIESGTAGSDTGAIGTASAAAAANTALIAAGDDKESAEAAKASDKADDAAKDPARKERDADRTKNGDRGNAAPTGSGAKGKDEEKKDKGTTNVVAPPPVDEKKEGPADKQEQSLDDLLRSSGVDPNAEKKKEGPKLDKKSLDATDIRSAMSALTGKAKGCYEKFGVSGSVGVKLTVAPSGEVKKAVATGASAGTPTGDCVADVAGSAKFPPWDGNQQTVTYSYFLSD